MSHRKPQKNWNPEQKTKKILQQNIEEKAIGFDQEFTWEIQNRVKINKIIWSMGK